MVYLDERMTSADALFDFYGDVYDTALLSADRPYTWSMSACSNDGITSWMEHGYTGPKEISLGHVDDIGNGSFCDFRMLCMGWTVSETYGVVLKKRIYDPLTLFFCLSSM